MAIYTNYPAFGGAFSDRISNLFQEATSVTIASDYTSAITLQHYQEDIARIINNGGNFTLLVGMAIFEGLNRYTYNRVEFLVFSDNCFDLCKKQHQIPI